MPFQTTCLFGLLKENEHNSCKSQTTKNSLCRCTINVIFHKTQLGPSHAILLLMENKEALFSDNFKTLLKETKWQNYNILSKLGFRENLLTIREKRNCILSPRNCHIWAFTRNRAQDRSVCLGWYCKQTDWLVKVPRDKNHCWNRKRTYLGCKA